MIPGLHPIWLEGGKKPNLQRSSFLFSWNFCETAIDRAYHSFIYIWENKGPSETRWYSELSYPLIQKWTWYEQLNYISIYFKDGVWELFLRDKVKALRGTVCLSDPLGNNGGNYQKKEKSASILETKPKPFPRARALEIFFLHHNAEWSCMKKLRTPIHSFLLRENTVSPGTAKTPSKSQHSLLTWRDEGEKEGKTLSTFLYSQMPWRWALIRSTGQPWGWWADRISITMQSGGSEYESQLYHLLALGPWAGIKLL